MKHKISLTAAALALTALTCMGLYLARLMLGDAKMKTDSGTADSKNISSSAEIFGDPEGDYSFAVPSGWRTETISSSSAAVYPEAQCKIGISSFPAIAEESRASWIAATVGADPTLSVREDSRKDMKVDGMPSVLWKGGIDGVSTTLIYIFTPRNTYEIAPSAQGSGSSDCGAAFGRFLEGLAFSAVSSTPTTQ